MAPKPITGEDVAKVLDDARAKMNDGGKHWIQHDFSRREGNQWSYCSLGAIGRVAPHTERGDELAERAKATLRKVIHGRNIATWNDARNRNWDDVSEAFKRAAEIARGD